MLGIENIGRSDDIFAVGLQSVHALRLVDQIEKLTGARLTVRAVYDAQTIERLAARMMNPPHSVQQSGEVDAVVRLNPGGSQRPLFYFHNDLIADGVYCRRLATAVGSAQPLYVIGPHGTAGLPLEYSIETMARDYVKRIHAIQHRGPFRLGGVCASGLVAYEVARQLRAQGERVESLVLINAVPVSSRHNVVAGSIMRAIGFNRRLPLRFRENACYNVMLLVEGMMDGPQGIVSFIAGRARAVFRRVQRSFASQEAKLDDVPSRRSAREVESVIAYHAATLTYAPQPYDGDLTLLWGEDKRLPAHDARAIWIRHAGIVRVISIAGGHNSPVLDGVEELGYELRKLLQRSIARPS